MGTTVRIANGQGFWGDSPDAAYELLVGGPIDYLGLDYLAEVTLSIMMRHRLRDPAKGYATDFIGFLRRALPLIAEGGVRVVTNAGGLNPAACRAEVFKVARELGLAGLKVGVVEGDDLRERIPELCAAGHHLVHMGTGARLCEVPHARVLSANVYLGARPVAAALDQGAQIVLAGRITDTALALGPLIHEFGWAPDDWDRLAAGTIAGHVIECGAQCTGGNFTRWWEVPDLWNVGYPVLECREDGSFVVTKHPGSGGMVTAATVSEQLVYEMGDPSSYISPDCIADFTSIRLADLGSDRVEATGVKGRPATPFYKVSASFHDRYKATGQLVVAGPRAVEKAELAAELVWKRLERAGYRFPAEDRIVELLGTGVCQPGVSTAPDDPPEVVLRPRHRAQGPPVWTAGAGPRQRGRRTTKSRMAKKWKTEPASTKRCHTKWPYGSRRQA
jgi:Acyclic terpene utilisation family protein AtuA